MSGLRRDSARTSPPAAAATPAQVCDGGDNDDNDDDDDDNDDNEDSYFETWLSRAALACWWVRFTCKSINNIFPLLFFSTVFLSTTDFSLLAKSFFLSPQSQLPAPLQLVPSLHLSPLRLSEHFVQLLFLGIGNFVSIGEEELISWYTNTSLENVIRQNLSN